MDISLGQFNIASIVALSCFATSILTFILFRTKKKYQYSSFIYHSAFIGSLTTGLIAAQFSTPVFIIKPLYLFISFGFLVGATAYSAFQYASFRKYRYFKSIMFYSTCCVILMIQSTILSTLSPLVNVTVPPIATINHWDDDIVIVTRDRISTVLLDSIPVILTDTSKFTGTKLAIRKANLFITSKNDQYFIEQLCLRVADSTFTINVIGNPPVRIKPQDYLRDLRKIKTKPTI